jgi:hypothetical protein
MAWEEIEWKCRGRSGECSVNNTSEESVFIFVTLCLYESYSCKNYHMIRELFLYE